MSNTLHCPFCDQDTDGLTLYSIAGAFRLFVCNTCYGLLVSKEHQPHSKPMKRLHWLLGLNPVRWRLRLSHGVNGREVVTHEGVGRCHTALSHTGRNAKVS